jgi:LytS/YehU family sensor histidine kinase
MWLPNYMGYLSLPSAIFLVWACVASLFRDAKKRPGRVLLPVGGSAACILAIIIIVAFSPSYSIMWGLWSTLAVHVLLIFSLGILFTRRILAARGRKKGKKQNGRQDIKNPSDGRKRADS